MSSGSEYSPDSDSDSSDSQSDVIPVIPDISRYLKSPSEDQATSKRKTKSPESQHNMINKSAMNCIGTVNSHTDMQGNQQEKLESMPKTNGDSAASESQRSPDVNNRRSQDIYSQPEQAENNQLKESQSENKEHSLGADCFVPHTNNIECRKYDKKFVCLYCGNLRSKLPDHLTAKHDEDEDVISWNEETDPSTKNKKYIRIRNLGNHLHNIRVLRKREGHLIVKYRPNGENANPDKYGPCPYCYGYYPRRELWRHNCPLKPAEAVKTKSKLAVSSLLLLPGNNMNSLLHKVTCTMKSDQISRVAKSDDTILKLGEKLCNKHGHDDDKHNYIRQKMRELARLLMELRRATDQPNNSLANFFHPKYYKYIVSCCRMVAGYDESRNRFGVPSLALKLGHSLQKCLKVVIGSCIESQNKTKENEVEELQKLMDLNWTDDMSSNALKTLQEEKRNRSDIIPLADDIKLFSDHLKSKAVDYSKQIEDTRIRDNDVSITVWSKLNCVVLAQLILFNRRRSGEVSRMQVAHYMAKQTADYGAQFETILSGFEKKLCFIMPRVEIEGKRGRTVAVLFPQYLVNTIDLLLQTRAQVVTDDNTFLFPAVHYGSKSHIRGSDCLRKLAAECGATAPHRLRSTNLRKHIATMSQVLNLKENELDILANFMGHDIRVHRDFYRLPEATVQVAKVAKLLIAMENGGTNLPAGKSLDDIQLDGETIEEDGECNTYFKPCSFLEQHIFVVFARRKD